MKEESSLREVEEKNREERVGAGKNKERRINRKRLDAGQ
jgi:hypothetical protein